MSELDHYSETVFKRKIGRLFGVHTETIDLAMPFIDAAGRFADSPGTVVLLSGSDLDCANYHILAVLPWMHLFGRGEDLTLDIDGETFEVRDNPFTTVSYLLDYCRLPSPDVPLPVAAGLFGYFSYDLKGQLERLPRTSIDDLGLPHICLFAPAALLVQDVRTKVTHLCIPEREGLDVADVRKSFYDHLTAPQPETSSIPNNSKSVSVPGQSNFERNQYMQTIERVRDYIAKGDVYQVNLSQRFQMDFSGNSWELFVALFERNPAPFFAYVQAGNHQIISTSPERFIRQTARHVETRPIKGTTPRGKTPDEDAQNRDKLVQSKKDDAELSMIVDLLRNDLGKVCEGGSVRVKEHKRVEAYHNVYHLVSIVEGVLKPNQNAVDLLRAAFPGGSITGCPKIRAMEIIDELEPHRRHVYTGSIGYIGFHDTMDLSIAIRTATVVGEKILFSVGGGIVIDSDPADEYDETLHKGRTLMEFCGTGGSGTASCPVVWRNGRLENISDARVPISDLGLQYGFGFFETIRADGGKARYLDAHIERFAATWRRLFPSPIPDLSWPEIIRQVAAANGLDGQVAAVKILTTFGSRTEPPWDYQVVVSARHYIHRLDDKKAAGLRLVTYDAPRQTPLADYKTTNYLYYYLAGNWARESGADEALILNPDGSVSETNAANILLIQGRTARVPASSHVLPGVMQGVVCSALKEFGYKVEYEKLMPGALLEADMVLCTNALMGAVPVVSLDGVEIRYRPELYDQVRARVL